MGSGRVTALLGHQVGAEGYHDGAVQTEPLGIEIDDTGIGTASTLTFDGHSKTGTKLNPEIT